MYNKNATSKHSHAHSKSPKPHPTATRGLTSKRKTASDSSQTLAALLLRTLIHLDRADILSFAKAALLLREFNKMLPDLPDPARSYLAVFDHAIWDRYEYVPRKKISRSPRPVLKAKKIGNDSAESLAILIFLVFKQLAEDGILPYSDAASLLGDVADQMPEFPKEAGRYIEKIIFILFEGGVQLC